jgi:hypothetical protein
MAQSIDSPGTLSVRLHRASGLMSADWNGLSDPYVVLSLGREHVRTSRILYRTLDPEWNELHQFDGLTLAGALASGLTLRAPSTCLNLTRTSRTHLADTLLSAPGYTPSRRSRMLPTTRASFCGDVLHHPCLSGVGSCLRRGDGPRPLQHGRPVGGGAHSAALRIHFARPRTRRIRIGVTPRSLLNEPSAALPSCPHALSLTTSLPARVWCGSACPSCVPLASQT